MIERDKIKLLETSAKDYDGWMTNIGKPRFHGLIHKPEFGFAIITDPLDYNGFGELLHHFRETEYARKVSIPKAKGEKGKWEEHRVESLDRKTIEDIVKKADQTALLFVSFLLRDGYEKNINNEIGFNLINPQRGIVRSTSLDIPGKEKEMYGWTGSDKEYKRILAIYVNPKST